MSLLAHFYRYNLTKNTSLKMITHPSVDIVKGVCESEREREESFWEPVVSEHFKDIVRTVQFGAAIFGLIFRQSHIIQKSCVCELCLQDGCPTSCLCTLVSIGLACDV